MGSWFSSNEAKETKLETSGEINNNVIIQDTVTVHNNEIIILLYIIAILKMAEFIIYIYNQYIKKIKKKYEARGIRA